MIQFKGVSKEFTKGKSVIRALDNVSLEVPQGAIALVHGPSGSGKSTLINVAAGLMKPTQGSVIVSGERLDQLSPGQCAAVRAKRIAVVFQLFHLVPYLTAFENVLLPTLADSTHENAVERAHGLLVNLGLEPRMTHFPEEMSAGERQRCALARALLNKPEVILADEPTGNLDPHSAKCVLKALGTARAEGATILLVSHQPVDSVHPDMEIRMFNGALEY